MPDLYRCNLLKLVYNNKEKFSELERLLSSKFGGKSVKISYHPNDGSFGSVEHFSFDFNNGESYPINDFYIFTNLNLINKDSLYSFEPKKDLVESYNLFMAKTFGKKYMDASLEHYKYELKKKINILSSKLEGEGKDFSDICDISSYIKYLSGIASDLDKKYKVLENKCKSTNVKDNYFVHKL